MNFDFSADQKAIQEQARNFLSEQCPLTRVRATVEGQHAFDESLWQQIVDLGWTATAIPEEFGGIGLSRLELCVIAEEMGRALAPVPFIASIYLAAEVIQLAASTAQQQQWLPDIAAGTVYTTALDSSNTPCRLEQGTLTGVKTAVLHGGQATQLIVNAIDSDSGELQLVKVDLGQARVERTALTSLDPSLPCATLRFEQVDYQRLEGGVPAAAVQVAAYDRAAVLLAFEQVGGCEASIAMAKEYTEGRYAFGRQVASFQAIKHKLADMFVAKELAKSNAYYGAWALASNAPELPLAAATARVSAIDAYWLCSKENIQAHGGMGFTWEFDCHLYYRRAQALSLLLGGKPRWANLLVDRLLAA